MFVTPAPILELEKHHRQLEKLQHEQLQHEQLFQHEQLQQNSQDLRPGGVVDIDNAVGLKFILD